MNRENGILELKSEIQKLYYNLQQNLDSVNKEEIRLLLFSLQQNLDNYRIIYDQDEIKQQLLDIRNRLTKNSRSLENDFMYSKSSLEYNPKAIDDLKTNLTALPNIMMREYVEIIVDVVMDQLRTKNRQNFFFSRDMYEIKSVISRAVEREAEQYRGEIKKCMNKTNQNIDEVVNYIMTQCPELVSEYKQPEQVEQVGRNLSTSGIFD